MRPDTAPNAIPELPEEIIQKVIINIESVGDHKIWKGGHLWDHGVKRPGFSWNGNRLYVQRLMYWLATDEDPKNFYLRKVCKIEDCVEPTHYRKWRVVRGID